MSLSCRVKKRLGDFLLDLSFETGGERLAILGASGSGKSLTLRCIAGIATPDEGMIVLNDRVLFDSDRGVNLPPQARRAGYLFQSYALFPHMTARQNLLTGMRRPGPGRLSDALTLLGLTGLEERYPAQLSGGQQQRVALARTLLSEPEALLLDEPFSALDPHLRERLLLDMREALRGYRDDLLLVTHSWDEACRLCGRSLALDGGRIIERGETGALLERPAHVQTARLTGCKNISPARRTGPRELLALDWGVRLHTQDDVGDGVVAVGIPAHRLRPAGEEAVNRLAVRATDLLRGQAGVRLALTCPQGRDGNTLWWTVPPDWTGDTPEALQVPPAAVLALR